MLTSGKEDDTYGQRLALAILPIAIVALIPASVAIWKELRSAKKADKADKADKDEKADKSEKPPKKTKE